LPPFFFFFFFWGGGGPNSGPPQFFPEAGGEKLGGPLNFREIQDRAKITAFWLQSGPRRQNIRGRDHLPSRLGFYARQTRPPCCCQDISERRHLEQQLRQAQKMEAIGRLARPVVATTSTNLLMVIKGHTELLLNVLPPSDHVARKIEQIDRSADRAAALTRQLLAFSRMQVLQPASDQSETLIEEIGQALRARLAKTSNWWFAPTEIGCHPRRCQPDGTDHHEPRGQFQRDAMPNRRQNWSSNTRNADLDQTYTASHPLMKPGAYIQLTVSDSGTGMDAETPVAHLRTLFHHKEKGKGTGTRSCHRLRHRQAEWRLHLGLQRTW